MANEKFISSVVKIETLDQRHLSISPITTVSNSSGAKIWTAVVQKVVSHALKDKHITVISCSKLMDMISDEVSAAARQALQFTESTIQLRNSDYFVSNISNASKDILSDLSGSQEFELCQLWFVGTSLSGSLEQRALELIQSMGTGCLPETELEVVLLTSDGAELVWLNPAQGIEDTITNLTELFKQ